MRRRSMGLKFKAVFVLIKAESFWKLQETSYCLTLQQFQNMKVKMETEDLMGNPTSMASWSSGNVPVSGDACNDADCKGTLWPMPSKDKRLRHAWACNICERVLVYFRSKQQLRVSILHRLPCHVTTSASPADYTPTSPSFTDIQLLRQLFPALPISRHIHDTRTRSAYYAAWLSLTMVVTHDMLQTCSTHRSWSGDKRLRILIQLLLPCSINLLFSYACKAVRPLVTLPNVQVTRSTNVKLSLLPEVIAYCK
eukprot:g57478.t1